MSELKEIMDNLSELEKEIIKEIYRFSKDRQFKYGLRQKYLIQNLVKKNYDYNEILDSIKELEKNNILYAIWRYHVPYWFIKKEYRGIGNKLQKYGISRLESKIEIQLSSGIFKINTIKEGLKDMVDLKENIEEVEERYIEVYKEGYNKGFDEGYKKAKEEFGFPFKINLVTKTNSINFMRIRVLPPEPKDWYSIKKKGKYYYFVKEGEGSKFITLDVGDLDEPKVQGLAFIRGFPRIAQFEIGEKVNWKYAKTQSVIAEYSALKVKNTDRKEKQIKAFLRKYKEDVVKFLSREYDKEIVNIKIVQKDKDFQLIIEQIY